MITARLNVAALRDPGWWHWTATLPLLILNLTGHAWAGWCAMALCGLFAGYFLTRLKSFRPYAVPVRPAYLVVLGGGMLRGWRGSTGFRSSVRRRWWSRAIVSCCGCSHWHRGIESFRSGCRKLHTCFCVSPVPVDL